MGLNIKPQSHIKVIVGAINRITSCFVSPTRCYDIDMNVIMVHKGSNTFLSRCQQGDSRFVQILQGLSKIITEAYTAVLQ